MGVLSALTLVGGLLALETDQYYAWDRTIADSAGPIDDMVNRELRRTLDGINTNPAGRELSCPEVAERMLPRLVEWIFHEVEIWAVNSPLVDRVPDGADEVADYRERYLYHLTGPLDVGTKMPPSPTIEVDGIRMGTDKLSHFFSQGRFYYHWYRGGRERGMSREAAELHALRRGLLWERSILGLMASGVLSVGDLEANYQGMRFLVDLCEGEPPGLVHDGDGWHMQRPFELRSYIGPEWDESYVPPIFSARRWKKVRPVLVGYCGATEAAAVVARRRRYAERDGTTLTEREVARLVESGRLEAPDRFALEANCPNRGEPERAATEHDDPEAGLRSR